MSHLQSDDTSRWGLWEVISSGGRILMNGISALINETPESSLVPPIMSGHNDNCGMGKRVLSHLAMLPLEPHTPNFPEV